MSFNQNCSKQAKQIFLSLFLKNMTTLDFKLAFKEPLNPLSANPTKWSNTLKQFVGNMPTNCLSVFDHFVGLALKGLIMYLTKQTEPHI